MLEGQGYVDPGHVASTSLDDNILIMLHLIIRNTGQNCCRYRFIAIDSIIDLAYRFDSLLIFLLILIEL